MSEIDNLKYNASKAVRVILETTNFYNLEERLAEWVYEAWKENKKLLEENEGLRHQLAFEVEKNKGEE